MRAALVLNVLAGILNITAFLVYNWLIFTGGAVPNATSWGVWAFESALSMTSYRAMTGDWMKSSLPLISGTQCILTFFLALGYNTINEFSVMEILVFVWGCAAGFVWYFARSPKFANLMIQAGTTIGFIPTFAGVWAHPAHEPALAWFLWSGSYLLASVIVLLRWRGKYSELVYGVNCTLLHVAIAVLALQI